MTRDTDHEVANSQHAYLSRKRSEEWISSKNTGTHTYNHLISVYLGVCVCVCVLQARKVEVKEITFNAGFITRMIPKIDWSVLRVAADTVRNR